MVAATGDRLAAIRAVRERFGLDLRQAKEVMLQAEGAVSSLAEHEERIAEALDLGPARVWYRALCVIADYEPMTYWLMANGAEFWWTLSGRWQLLTDRFADEPFRYSEIVTATVFREVPKWRVLLGPDWEALRGELASITGLCVEPVSDLVIPPAWPPNGGVRLSVIDVG